MSRPNIARTIGAEETVARRIQSERLSRHWTYDAVARHMTEAGCAMHGSAVHKIENGTPRRRITVDELVAFSIVFDISLDDLVSKPGLDFANARRNGSALVDAAYRKSALWNELKATEAEVASTYQLFVESITETMNETKIRSKLTNDSPPSTDQQLRELFLFLESELASGASQSPVSGEL